MSGDFSRNLGLVHKDHRVKQKKGMKRSAKMDYKRLVKILAHARRWQAIIYFEDESAIRLTAMLGTTWAKKEKHP